ncbi:MAG TPA: AsnC family protein [Thermoplasmata archaeon]|nr:AsnC family protein [Thermoplasmata archaeon]
MASVDWDLFRALYESSACPNWQTKARPDIRSLARRAGVAYSTAWTKLKGWRDTGFLQAPNFFPHPSFFGVGLEVCHVRHEDPASRGLFLDQLERVDGVFLAHPEMGEETAIITIADDEDSRAHRFTSIAEIPGVASISARSSVWLPTPVGELSPNDLRLIAALRETPEASFDALGRRLGWWRGTVSRQFRALSESFRILAGRTDLFSRFPETVVAYKLELDPAFSARRVAKEIGSRLPELLEVAGISHPPFSEAGHLFYAVAVPNAAQIDEIAARLRGFVGVTGVTSRIPGSERAYPGWFDRRIAHELGHSRGPSPGSASRPPILPAGMVLQSA